VGSRLCLGAYQDVFWGVQIMTFFGFSNHDILKLILVFKKGGVFDMENPPDMDTPLAV